MTGIALGYELYGETSKQSMEVGVGNDSKETFQKFLNIVVCYYEPVSREDSNIVKKFHGLRLTWQYDIKYSGFVAEMVLNPAYQEIIAMGKSAIPLILNELKKEPHHWFWALSSITGLNPILPEQRGKMQEMVKAWLAWGKEHEYID